MEALKTMKVNELKAIAKEKNIKGWWDMKKVELIDAIEALAEELIAKEPIVKEVVEEVEVPETVAETISEAPEEVEAEDNVDVKVDEENVSESTEEAHRKNKKRLIEYNGETKTLTAWAKDLGIRHQTLYNRIVMKGMDPAEAFEMPLKKGKKKEVETA